MTLGLFFSRGVSLKLWLEKGLFEREKLLYEEHIKQNNISTVYWFTYGHNDEKIAQELKKNNQLSNDIEIISMPQIFILPKIGSYIYSILLPFVQKKYINKCDIYKTNQTDGSWSAVIAKKLYKRKLLYRTGFTISQLENKLLRFNILLRKSIEMCEYFAYNYCDKAVVSSQHNLVYVTQKYDVKQENISVIYNFIDRKQFYDFQKTRENTVVFVGRLSDEKNIFNLISALNKVGLALKIYGSGPLKSELEDFINKYNFNVQLMGNISNDKLPEVLNKCKYFTLVSKHEGMPKSLIEGMACACICIGTNVSGINEVIVNNNGILADDITVDTITEAFEKAQAMSDSEVDEIMKNTQLFIDKSFTLDNIVEKEKSIFKDLLS